MYTTNSVGSQKRSIAQRGSAMYCKNCGAQIEDICNFCPVCGAYQGQTIYQPPIEQQQITQQQTYHQPIEKAPKREKKKFCDTWWFWTLFVIFWMFVIVPNVKIAEKPGPSSFPSTSNTSSIRPALDERSQFIADAQDAGLSESASIGIYDLLKDQLLCTNIKFKCKSIVGNALYEISEKEYALKVAADNDGIYSVRCGSYEMYDGETVHYTVQDIALRDIDGNEAYYSVIAKEIVSSYLKAPSTAKFPFLTEFRMQRYGDIVAVSGYVDSQNSFGAMIRSEWVVQFETDHSNMNSYAYQLLYVRIADQETGEFIPLE